MDTRKIVVLGAGNLAIHLTQALYRAGYQILQVFSRTMDSAQALAEKVNAQPFNNLNELNKTADIVIVCITDGAVSAVLEGLDVDDRTLILHTSGSIPLSIFENRFKNVGVLYPFQTFSKFRVVAFDTLPIFIEANTKDNLGKVLAVGRSLSSNVNIADSQQREKIHISGIFANNFVNYFYALSAQMIKTSGFGFDVLKPIILETAMKALESGNPKNVQTGPAVRQNIEIIKRHVQLLAPDPDIQNLYTFVSENILKTYHNLDHI
jgi:predicted short-subunit dehydrogenase-like oxidoreductase (DUF2520 family)